MIENNAAQRTGGTLATSFAAAGFIDCKAACVLQAAGCKPVHTLAYIRLQYVQPSGFYVSSQGSLKPLLKSSPNLFCPCTKDQSTHTHESAYMSKEYIVS